MNTIPKDLLSLIDRHLNCYETIFLTETEITKTKWAMYFYRDDYDDHFISLFNDPDEKLMRLLDEVKINGLKLKSYNISKLGFILNDFKLIYEGGHTLFDRAIFSDSNKFFIRAINKQQTEIILQYHRNCADSNIERLVAAYKIGNQIIIDHIESRFGEDSQIVILLKLLVYNNNEFKKLFNIEKYLSILPMLIYSAILLDNKDMYRFLMNFEPTKNRNFLLESCLDYAMRLKLNTVVELIFSDLTVFDHKKIINHSYTYGCSKIFYKLVNLDPTLIDLLDIFGSMNDVDLEILKFVLIQRPPSQREISQLMRIAINSNRYDLYCYLCTVGVVIDDNAKILSSSIKNL